MQNEIDANESRAYAAVFSDVDETLIAQKSLFEFARQLAATLPPEQSVALSLTLGELGLAMRRGFSRSELNRRYYREVLAGRSIELVQRVSHDWFRSASRQPDAFFKPGPARMLAAARRQGARVVLVSGSFHALVQPVAARVAAVDMLVTPLETRDGSYTGRFEGTPLIGPGKALAVREYAAAHGLDLARCAGIGDDPTDIPFLELLGHPHVPADAHAELRQHASAAGWSIVDS